MREETQINKLGTTASKRAWKFQMQLRKGKGESKRKKCLNKVEEGRRRVIQLTRFEDIRSGFFNTEYVGEGTKVNYVELEKRERERQ